MAQNLRCFELSGPLLSGKQNLARGNQNVWSCQGLGMSRMGYNLLDGLQPALGPAGAGGKTPAARLEQDGRAERPRQENMDHFFREKAGMGGGQSLKATALKSCNFE